MDIRQPRTAIYLVGHGPNTRPRLIELQFRQILRYRDALAGCKQPSPAPQDIFIDIWLPRFGMGQVDLHEVPGFQRLLAAVRTKRCTLVFIDVEEISMGLTPRHESTFVRSMLEEAGAKVLNVFNDADGVLKNTLRTRYGSGARDYEVTDSSDIICFFPGLASEVASSALSRELQDASALQTGQLRRIIERIVALRELRPYAGGCRPFIDERLTAEWSKLS